MVCAYKAFSELHHHNYDITIPAAKPIMIQMAIVTSVVDDVMVVSG